MLVGKALKAAKTLAKRKAVAKIKRKAKQDTRRLNQGRSFMGKRPGGVLHSDTAIRRIHKGRNRRPRTSHKYEEADEISQEMVFKSVMERFTNPEDYWGR
jgi:hypothetical protein